MTKKPPPNGCTVILLLVNLTLMGSVALSFGLGPYSSAEQEFWYRYVSLGFVLAGAVLPLILVMSGITRSEGLSSALNGWMSLMLFGWFLYVMVSGGGV